MNPWRLMSRCDGGRALGTGWSSRRRALVISFSLALALLNIFRAFTLDLVDVATASLNVEITRNVEEITRTVLRSFENKSMDKSTDNPPNGSIEQSHDTKPQKKYIVADLRFGLTNQANEAWVSVLIAERLNRTLVLPQVRAKIPKGEIAAEENGILEDFDYVWDSEHFTHCAREKLNKPGLAFATNRYHYDVHINQNDTFLMQIFDGITDRISPLLYQNPAFLINDTFLGRLVADNASYIKIINPFQYEIARKWNSAECFIPSHRVNKMIAAYKSKLPVEYACLHARTESDWYSHACCEKHGNTTSENIEEWNCPIHPVSETCYKSPQQIADMLKSELDSNTTLWISSGSSRQALQPLYDSWNVVTKDAISLDDSYMDYGLAQVDKAICSGATIFWGMGGSTFTGDIAAIIQRNGGTAIMYGRKNWEEHNWNITK